MSFKLDFDVSLTYSQEIDREEARGYLQDCLDQGRQSGSLHGGRGDVSCDEIYCSIREDDFEEDEDEDEDEEE